MKVVETKAGTVRWGNLFATDEIVALVNLLPPVPDAPDNEPSPRYLSLYVWSKEKWRFRQFLGQARGLNIHYRRDFPSVFLQASYQTGRYEGEHISWFYDPKSHLLKETHFEVWGPFYLAGPYLVLERGFERLAHDDTRWVYTYKDGRKGELLTVFHTRDDDRFDVTFRNGGKMESWHFVPDPENEAHLTVSIFDGTEEGGSAGNAATGTGDLVFEGKDGSPSADYFWALLTGLNPRILGTASASSNLGDELQWCDKLPPSPPLAKWPVRATGDPRIIARFGTGK